MASLMGKTIAFLTSGRGVEESELTEPWAAVERADGIPLLVTPDADEVHAVRHDLEPAGTYPVDRRLDRDPVSAEEIDALVLPGGTVNADKLRMHDDAVALARAVVDAGKPVAAICHGPWLLVEAGVVGGKELTSYPSLATDIRNAGGAWRDAEAVVDTQGFPLLTSRSPRDLPAFTAELERLVGG